jgi:RNA 2',3'-cyclic 3'-phosphodiesterase
MRVFLAIDLDDPARAAAAAWAKSLSARLTSAAAREIKWVETPNLHLSLHFFGELRDDQVDAVRRLLAAPYETRAFAIALAGAGTFPPTGSARVIWLGVREEENTGGMQTIYRAVQARLGTLGLQDPSTRAFTPHLTIGRVRTPGSDVTRSIREALRATPAPSPTFLVPHLTLYQSRLSPKGPTYLPIERFPLAP